MDEQSGRVLPAAILSVVDAVRAKKADDVLALDLREAGAFTDWFIVCTGQNRRQVQAIADAVEAALKARKLRPSHVEGYERGEWILLDYFDFVVHVFAPNARSFYSLERLWGSGQPVALARSLAGGLTPPAPAADAARRWPMPRCRCCCAPCCATCGAVLERPLDGAVCAGCWARVARFSPPLCLACGEPLPSRRTHPEERCRVCSVTLGAGAAARSVGGFEGVLADVVHALKYGRRPSVARPLAVLMRIAGRDLLADVDLVVPVPLHRRRLRERGFNQAEALARGLGPPLCHALKRARRTPAQVELSGEARRANLAGAFALRRDARLVRGRCVALVDDVLTTGATVAACADTLAVAAPREVVVITAARAASARPR